MKIYDVPKIIHRLLCGAFCLLMLASSAFLLKQQWMEWRVKKTKGADSSITVSVTVPSAIPPAPPPSPPAAAPSLLSSGRSYMWREIPAGGVVTFEGLAQPRALVALKKDNRITATFLADNVAQFYKEISGLEPGFYTFGLFSTDEDNTDSVMLSFRMQIEKSTKSAVAGVFIPPTISVSEAEIAEKQPLFIYGQTVPESLVAILLEPAGSSQITFADKSGKWSYWLDTSDLKPDEYNVKVKALTPNGRSSEYGKAIYFKIIKEKLVCKIADLNCDGKIELTDFSILLYWWRKTDFYKAPQVDINRDGKVDLIDFSIMLHYWKK